MQDNIETLEETIVAFKEELKALKRKKRKEEEAPTRQARQEASNRERFFRNVIRGEHPAECWGWSASTDGRGYGKIGVGNLKIEKAHRLSWIIHNGPIPEGMCVLHRCDNPPCSNPDHLFLGTKADNTADMVDKGRAKGGAKKPAKGETHYNAKLTDSQIEEIKRLYNKKTCNQYKLADLFNVTQGQISMILNGKRRVI
jgi:predicted XRE-type DNA-binding protein